MYIVYVQCVYMYMYMYIDVPHLPSVEFSCRDTECVYETAPSQTLACDSGGEDICQWPPSWPPVLPPRPRGREERIPAVLPWGRNRAVGMRREVIEGEGVYMLCTVM